LAAGPLLRIGNWELKNAKWGWEECLSRHGGMALAGGGVEELGE